MEMRMLTLLRLAVEALQGVLNEHSAAAEGLCSCSDCESAHRRPVHAALVGGDLSCPLSWSAWSGLSGKAARQWQWRLEAKVQQRLSASEEAV
jgi:hypothetical protein